MIERNNQSSRAVAMGAERTVGDNTVGSRGLAASANGYEIFCLTKGRAYVLIKSPSFIKFFSF